MTTNKLSPEIEAVEDRQKCKKCGGAGWVWGRELDDPSEDTYQDDMTKYSCDWCNRDDDEAQQPLSLEGCVEHRRGGDVIVGENQQTEYEEYIEHHQPPKPIKTQTRDWLHENETAIPRKAELLEILRDQLRVAMLDVPPPCACCGVRRKWYQLHRCFFCGLWFCVRCGKRHFGER